MERVAAGNKRARAGGVPKLSELLQATSNPVPPSDDILQKLGQHTVVAGVDIETADWVDGSTRSSMHQGQFGFLTRCRSEVFNQRIVQIGWAIGDASLANRPTECRELTIKPDGFRIAEKATKLHGITNDHAMQGVPLREALLEFMDAMRTVVGNGGRVIIHHLEFDAGIIEQELLNAGLNDIVPVWVDIATNGYCTMDPGVCKWVQICKGRIFEPHENNNVLSLEKLLDLLLPTNKDVQGIKRKLHTAGADAQAHRLIYIALRNLAEQVRVQREAI